MEDIKANKLVAVNPEQYELTQDRAEGIVDAFAHKIAERDNFAAEYEEILSMVIDEDTCKAARDLRLKMVPVRTGIDRIHKTQKQFFLKAGQFIDAYKNAAKLPLQQMEEKLKEIETYHERQEADRIKKLHDERTNLLNEIGVAHHPAGLAQMNFEEWNAYYDDMKIAQEAKRKAEEAAEAAIKAEEARREAERLEKQKKDEEERRRLAAEKAKLEAQLKEQRKKAAAEKAKREENERKEREAHEVALAKERERIAKLEAEREKQEKAEKERQRKEAEKAAAEKAKREDEEHRRTINNKVLSCLVSCAKLSEEDAKRVITAIAKGEISGLTINY